MAKRLQIRKTAPHSGWLWALSIQSRKEQHGLLLKDQRTSGSTEVLRSMEGETELSGTLPNTSVPSCCVLFILIVKELPTCSSTSCSKRENHHLCVGHHWEEEGRKMWNVSIEKHFSFSTKEGKISFEFETRIFKNYWSNCSSRRILQGKHNMVKSASDKGEEVVPKSQKHMKATELRKETKKKRKAILIIHFST